MWKCGKLNASKEDDDEEDTFSEDKAEAIITHSSVASSPPLRRPRVLISLDAKRVRRALFMAAQTKMDRRRFVYYLGCSSYFGTLRSSKTWRRVSARHLRARRSLCIKFSLVFVRLLSLLLLPRLLRFASARIPRLNFSRWRLASLLKPRR